MVVESPRIMCACQLGKFWPYHLQDISRNPEFVRIQQSTVQMQYVCCFLRRISTNDVVKFD